MVNKVKWYLIFPYLYHALCPFIAGLLNHAPLEDAAIPYPRSRVVAGGGGTDHWDWFQVDGVPRVPRLNGQLFPWSRKIWGMPAMTQIAQIFSKDFNYLQTSASVVASDSSDLQKPLFLWERSQNRWMFQGFLVFEVAHRYPEIFEDLKIYGIEDLKVLKLDLKWLFWVRHVYCNYSDSFRLSFYHIVGLNPWSSRHVSQLLVSGQNLLGKHFQATPASMASWLGYLVPRTTPLIQR